MSTATTTAMSHTTIESDLSKRSTNRRYFALCNLCFWCASYLWHMDAIKCSSCNTEIIEPIPIRSDEAFLFQYDRKRGVSLQFLTA
jgi:hypothetical protein